LRRVVLARADGNKRTLDLLSYFQTGDMANNPLLRPGDGLSVGFAPEVVRIEGAVVNPGSYELLEGEGIERLVELASGLGPEALPSRARIVRRSEAGSYQTILADPTAGAGTPLEHGDVFRVPSRRRIPRWSRWKGILRSTPGRRLRPHHIPDRYS
jgi:protein involved in polysaccharide export with SLBB domain